MQTLGVIQSVWRYPVKSMGGEQVDEGHASFTGLTCDRAFALIAPERPSKWPWVTARDQPSLLSYCARYASGVMPANAVRPEVDARSVEIVAPNGQVFAADEHFADRLRREFDCELRIRCSERSMVDAFPLSIVSMQTVRALSEECGAQLDPRRFRANLYVDWENADAAFFEDELVGREVMIGEQVKLKVEKRDSRCKIISLDPISTEENAEVLRTVAKNHGGYTGVYAAVLREGIVRAGDAVALIS